MGNLALSTTPPLSGATAVGGINAALAALASLNASASAPTAGSTGLSSLAGVVWHDTTTATLKVRDQADTSWIIIGYFDETAKTWTPHINPAAVYSADAGSANAYVVTPKPAWATYATGGPILAFVAANANTGASTINVSGLGVKNIVRRDGSTLVAGDIPGTNVSLVVWNAAAGNFTLLTQRPPAVAFLAGVFSNLALTAPGGTQSATITADAAVLLDAAGNPYLATAASVTPSLAASGAGGLDTGAVAANTWYAAFLIWNGTTLQGLYSLSRSAPALPSGYTFKAFCGYVRTDASGTPKIIAFNQIDDVATWTNTGSGLLKLASGSNVGSISTPTWVSFSTAAGAPPGAQITISVYSQNVVVGVAPSSSYGSHQSTTNPPPVLLEPPTSNAFVQLATLTLETAATLFWYNNDPGTTRSAIYAYGYKLNL